MSGHSFSKYAQRITTDTDGVPLHWGRAETDGAPFRGAEPPLIKEGEEEKSIRHVSDVRTAFFDLRIPEEKAKYDDVLDKIHNNLFLLIYLKRFVEGQRVHYIEWAERYTEAVDPSVARMLRADLGAPAPFPEFFTDGSENPG